MLGIEHYIKIFIRKY